MTAFRIVALCIAAALVCTTLRAAHPQVAAVAALAAGVGALMLSVGDLGRFASALRTLEQTADAGGANGAWLVRLCGIALVAELASDVCRDAGEAALAKRIDMGVRLSIAAAALPLAAQILERISELLA